MELLLDESELWKERVNILGFYNWNAVFVLGRNTDWANPVTGETFTVNKLKQLTRYQFYCVTGMRPVLLFRTARILNSRPQDWHYWVFPKLKEDIREKKL